MGLQVLDSTIPGPPGPKGDKGDVGPGVINWRGAYDNATAYTLNDAVSYQGSSYICITSTTGNLPTNTSFWNLLAQKGDSGESGATGAAGADGLDITWRGAYDNGTAYVVNDAVSYQGSSYICKSPTTGNVPTNATFWDLMASKGDTGSQGIQGVQGVQGAHGGAITIRYTISDQTGNTDPGNGVLRLDNFSTQNTATVIRADHVDADGIDWSSVLQTLDDSNSTIKGHIRLVNPSDQSKWLLFTVASVGSETGYNNINVTNVGSSGTNPFTNGQTILLTFTRQGDKGDAGATGASGTDGLDITWRGAYDNGTVYAINEAVSYQGSSYIAIASTTGNLPTNSSFWNLMAQQGDAGAQGPAGSNGVVGAHGGGISIQYTFDDTTTDSDPGNGLLRLSNSTQNTATMIRADHLDTNGTDWTSVLTSLDDSTSINKGQIRLFKADDQSKWLLFNVTAVGSEIGYKNITVANVASSATSPFANGNSIVIAFSRTGDKGETGSQGTQGVQGDPGEDGLDISWRDAYDNGTTYSINDAVSYQGSSYIAIASTVGNLPTNTSFWNLLAQKGDTGAAGSNGTNGSNGQHGGGITAEWEFDSTTTDSDPGAGKLRLSNSTQNASTVIRVDHLDFANTDWSAVLPTLDDSTSTIKGHIRLVHRTDQSKWLLFTVSAVGAESGYKNITVTNVGSSTSSPFTNGDLLVLTFTRTGDKGDTGSTGSTGAQGQDGGAITIVYTFSTITTDSDPGNGNLRLNQSTQNTATVIRTDLLDSGGNDWTTVLDSLDDSTSTVKGHIRLVHATDYTKWIVFTVSAVASQTGYRNITVAVVQASTSSPFGNGDLVLLTFVRTGDQGIQGLTGNPGLDGSDGADGGAVTIEYTFSTTTTDSDPGSGNLRLSNATQNASTAIRADLVDSNGTTWTSVLDSLDDSTSTIKGHIRLVHATDFSKWLLFTVSAVDSSVGYRNITVSNVASSSASPFTNGDRILLAFTRQGDKGDTGATGSAGSNGSNGTNGVNGGAAAITYTFSTTTTDSDPGSGNLRLNQSTQNTATVIRADLLDSNSTDWTTALDSFDDSSSTIKGYIRLVQANDQSKWLLFSVSSVASPSGYRNITVANVASSASSPFSNGASIVLEFTRNGDKGDINGSAVIAVECAWSTNTGTGDPGTSKVKVNNSDFDLVTVVRLNTTDVYGADWVNALGALQNPDLSTVAYLRVLKKTDPTKWVVFAVSDITFQTGYVELSVGGGMRPGYAVSFSADDPIICIFDVGTGADSINPTAIIDIFQSTGFWMKRTGASRITGLLVGGGGGGGSGRKGANSTDRNGGTGGAGGGATLFDIAAGSAGSTELVTVGAGGTGGTAQTTNSTNGNAGNNGVTTSFGSLATATGGTGGQGGGTVNGVGPNQTSVGTGTYSGGIGGGGGNGSGTPAVAGGAPGSALAGAGGGGGGGIASGNSVAPAGIGGATGFFSGGLAGSTTPTGGGSGAATVKNHLGYGGSGGGGGGSNSASVSNDRAGGPGGYYGAGGGGGGAGRDNTSNSGAGGDGAQGIAIIVTYF